MPQVSKGSSSKYQVSRYVEPLYDRCPLLTTRAIIIQKVVRGFLVRNKIVLRLRCRTGKVRATPFLNRTATKIQKVVRGWLTRRLIRNLTALVHDKPEDVEIFTKLWFDLLSRPHYPGLTSPAVQPPVQPRIPIPKPIGRQDIHKYNLHVKKRWECATLNIQRVWRGSRGRKLAGRRRAVVNQKERAEERARQRQLMELRNAVLRVQRIGRGALSRQKNAQSHAKAKFAACKTAILKLQRVGRGYIERQHVPALKRIAVIQKSIGQCGAVEVQRIWRGFAARKWVREFRTLLPHVKAAITIQCAWRSSLARVVALYYRVRKACINIQRMYRGYRGRMLYGVLKYYLQHGGTSAECESSGQSEIKDSNTTLEISEILVEQEASTSPPEPSIEDLVNEIAAAKNQRAEQAFFFAHLRLVEQLPDRYVEWVDATETEFNKLYKKKLGIPRIKMQEVATLQEALLEHVHKRRLSLTTDAILDRARVVRDEAIAFEALKAQMGPLPSYPISSTPTRATTTTSSPTPQSAGATSTAATATGPCPTSAGAIPVPSADQTNLDAPNLHVKLYKVSTNESFYQSAANSESMRKNHTGPLQQRQDSIEPLPMPRPGSGTSLGPSRLASRRDSNESGFDEQTVVWNSADHGAATVPADSVTTKMAVGSQDWNPVWRILEGERADRAALQSGGALSYITDTTLESQSRPFTPPNVLLSNRPSVQSLGPYPNSVRAQSPKNQMKSIPGQTSPKGNTLSSRSKAKHFIPPLMGMLAKNQSQDQTFNTSFGSSQAATRSKPSKGLYNRVPFADLKTGGFVHNKLHEFRASSLAPSAADRPTSAVQLSLEPLKSTKKVSISIPV